MRFDCHDAQPEVILPEEDRHYCLLLYIPGKGEQRRHEIQLNRNWA